MYFLNIAETISDSEFSQIVAETTVQSSTTKNPASTTGNPPIRGRPPKRSKTTTLRDPSALQGPFGSSAQQGPFGSVSGFESSASVPSGNIIYLVTPTPAEHVPVHMDETMKGEEYEVNVRILSGFVKLPYSAEVDMISISSATQKRFTLPVITPLPDGSYTALTEVVEMPVALAGTVQGGLKTRETFFGFQTAELSALGEQYFEAYATDQNLDWKLVKTGEKGGNVYEIDNNICLIANELTLVVDIYTPTVVPPPKINRRSMLLAHNRSNYSSSSSSCSQV